MKINEYNYTKVCPKCTSTDIKYGHQKDYSAMKGKHIFSTSKVHYFICGNCGYIVDQFVDQPDRMKEIPNN